jgi:hypothetical protein
MRLKLRSSHTISLSGYLPDHRNTHRVVSGLVNESPWSEPYRPNRCSISSCLKGSIQPLRWRIMEAQTPKPDQVFGSTLPSTQEVYQATAILYMLSYYRAQANVLITPCVTQYARHLTREGWAHIVGMAADRTKTSSSATGNKLDGLRRRVFLRAIFPSNSAKTACESTTY